MNKEWFDLCPGLSDDKSVFSVVCACTNALQVIGGDQAVQWSDVDRIRDSHLVMAEICGAEEVKARTCVSVICDLFLQGWKFQISDATIWATQPRNHFDSSIAEKARVRANLLVERDAQLRTGSVRSFVYGMEQQKYHSNGWVSIFSLMRDGSELAAKLRQAQQLDDITQTEFLQQTIDPYIQCVDDSRCEHTGILLKEIWRYFRHTWVTPYQSVPGRNIWFLIRDRASKYHPIIGIAALGSAIVQLTVRDQWIGWNRDAFLTWAKSNLSENLATWVWSSLDELIKGIYLDDFLASRLLSLKELNSPDNDTIARLRDFSHNARTTHQLYPHAAEHKSGEVSEEAWLERTKTYLFQSKRATTLASLLKARQQLLSSGFDSPTLEALKRGMGSATGKNAIAEIVRQVKAAHVGNDMMDIIICGAVQPYNAILGGKLVALLMTSPEVAEAYNNRYRGVPSIIASSMAGRPVFRTPRLVFLGTTSLYSVSSSQYNRLRIPASEIGGSDGGEIRYHQLGRTEGFGSYHFSATTLTEMEKLIAKNSSGRRVNSIFGEGVNPRLRKIRDALQLAGFRGESLLYHGDRRIIYGVPLAANFREYLLGFEKEVKGIFPDEPVEQSTGRIIDFWIRRWLAGRIASDDVIEEVSRHNLLHPIRHGARVFLPSLPEDTPLFSE